MKKHDQHQKPQNFELQDDCNKQFITVQSAKKRRQKCLMVILALVIVAVIVAIVVPFVLLYGKGDQTSDSSTPEPATTQPTSEWGSWTVCSVTCGNGTRQRTQECTYTACNVTVEKLLCQNLPCNESASLEQWGQWSSCSKTCAVGTQFRRREYNSGGNERQTRSCNIRECTRIDCSAWFRSGRKTNGVYKVDPDDRGSFPVYCDMTTDGGGWTVFQRRQDGSVDFYRTWDEYKTGFGNLSGEFWLGNENIHRLTTSLNTSLYIDIEDWSGLHYNASYDLFRVGSENYTLTVYSYSGDAGDSLTHHSAMMFTTKDRDNDKEQASNCAVAYLGGWWFNACIQSNLNGKYVDNTRDRQGIIWLKLSTLAFQSMKSTEMKLRRWPV